jgi:hypothetical protein
MENQEIVLNYAFGAIKSKVLIFIDFYFFCCSDQNTILSTGNNLKGIIFV